MKKLLFILALLFSAPSIAATQIDLETQVKGVLPQANGGTGATSVLTVSGTPAVGDLLYMNGSNTAALLPAGASGEVLTAAGAATPPAWAAAGGGGTPGGSNGQIQFNNAGAFGGIATTGTGDAVLATSPTLITPALGVATATSLTASGAINTAGLLQINAVESVTSAGSDQAGATALSATKTIHFVDASINQGVRLPTATNIGEIHFIRQVKASPITNWRIYPASGDTITGLAVNAHIAAFGTQTYQLMVIAANTWAIIGTNITNGASMNVQADTNSGLIPIGISTSFDITGRLRNGSGNNTVFSITAPSAPTACTSPSVTSNTGTAGFTVNVGTSCAVSTLTLTMPSTSVASGYVCTARNVTNGATSAPAQTGAVSTSAITITNFSRTTGIAANWTDGDVIAIGCIGH